MIEVGFCTGLRFQSQIDLSPQLHQEGIIVKPVDFIVLLNPLPG